MTDGDKYPKYRKYLETEVFLLSTLYSHSDSMQNGLENILYFVLT